MINRKIISEAEEGTDLTIIKAHLGRRGVSDIGVLVIDQKGVIIRQGVITAGRGDSADWNQIPFTSTRANELINGFSSHFKARRENFFESE